MVTGRFNFKLNLRNKIKSTSGFQASIFVTIISSQSQLNFKRNSHY